MMSEHNPSKQNRKEYYKTYQKYHYQKTRKMVTFALLNAEHKKLKDYADKLDVTANSLSKNIILNYLENIPNTFQTTEQKKLLQEYMRISRGIATNINQMARSSNIGEIVDINILIQSLKNYEDEFKKLLSKLL
jgi:hypothetical protein